MGGDIEGSGEGRESAREHADDLEPNRWYREKPTEHRYFDLVVEEGSPNLIRRLTAANHVLADVGLAAVNEDEAQKKGPGKPGPS